LFSHSVINASSTLQIALKLHEQSQDKTYNPPI